MQNMATIRPTEDAPADGAKYILPTATFDLESGGSFETDDRTVLLDAEAHPWLEVEYDEQDSVVYERPSQSVPYEDDVLTAPNSVAFDLAEVRETEEAKGAVAVEAENEAAPVAPAPDPTPSPFRRYSGDDTDPEA